ncbi:L,D-transpeptidase family protein [Anaeroselena agilis]|uniref:L,D-transpeptidase family protein n=1 Tax=Anaeroselena agilis TaxID=3063788 RepID=A0ABU3P057_9FIRM|nr:L,D-transpeptidase family protein [Selenomonadales bacterium 4137-cl]
MRMKGGVWRRRPLYWAFAGLVLVALAVSLAVADYIDDRDLAAAPGQKISPPAGEVSLKINVQKRTLEVYDEGRLHKTYRVAVGKSSTPTPFGEWKVVWKDYNWGTGFGTRWMGLNVPWGTFGIHGTNKPWSIGSFASHGCIRMRNRDVEELFEWVKIGTPVAIEGGRTRLSRTLKYQSVGPDVVLVQLKLKELGYLESRADGIYGLVTEEAVKRFQRDRGLEENGTVGAEALTALGLKQ